MSKNPNSKPRRTEAFYWPKHGFYTRNQQAEWVNTDKETIRMKLIRAGFSSTKDDFKLSPASSAMLDVIEKKTVHYAGPLAGHSTGLKELCGKRILVTSQPPAVCAKRGKFPLWQEIIETQYGEQSDYFLTWLKTARQRLLLGGGPMLPALVCAGLKNTGKSLAQNHLITPLLGGRTAKPWRYWTGETQFNEDLCGAEHLMLEDDVCPVKPEKRRLFAAALKAAVANETTSLHPKGDKALSVECLWAISVSTNLEPQILRQFPFHEDGCGDKMLVLHIKNRPTCFPDSDDFETCNKFTRKLHAEIPAIAAFLDKYVPPEKIKDPEKRSPMAAYRDPYIMEICSEDDAVPKLIWLIDESKILGDPIALERCLTSMDLERDLMNANTNGQAARLLGKAPLGYLLREAAKRFPARIVKFGEAHKGITKWTIRPERKE